MNKPAFDPSQPFQPADKPVFDPSKPFDVSTVETPGQTLTRKIGIAGDQINKLMKDPIGTAGPLGLPAAGMKAITEGVKIPSSVPFVGGKTIPGSRKIGETVTNDLLSQGKNPLVAKVLGGVVKYAPDIISMAVPGEIGQLATETGELPVGAMAQEARDLAGKATGFTKRFLNTGAKEAKQQMASQVLLENGVPGILDSSRKTADKVLKLSNDSGQQIGNILKSQNIKLAPQDFVNELETLRPQAKGGYWDQIHAKLNRAINTVKGFGEGENGLNPITAKQAHDIKGVLQDVAYSPRGTFLDRMVAGLYRDKLDTSLEQAAQQIGDPQKFQDFMKAKRIYSAAQTATDPIYNRISSELGNKGISLTDWLATIPAEIALGSPERALLFVVGKKGMEKYGPQIGANLLRTASQASKGPMAINAAASAIRPYASSRDSNLLSVASAAFLKKRSKQ